MSQGDAFVGHAVRVQVPATSANLGPGFDALGLALGIHDRVGARVVAEGIHVAVRGEGAEHGEAVARDESHLVVRSMFAAFECLGVSPPGLDIDCVNTVPHGRGLGSSAAAIVAGVLLARALVADGPQRLDDAALLALASSIEGHPDNVAPCLLGGLTIAWTDGGTARAVRRDLDPAIVPVVLIPPFTSSTELARGLLPAVVPHADAAFAAGRAALLVAALTGAPDVLFEATEDRLHQAYRAPAMAQSWQLVTTLRGRGHPAVISGAGPTVFVPARGQLEAEAIIAAAPTGWRAERVPIDVDGARLLSSVPSAGVAAQCAPAGN